MIVSERVSLMLTSSYLAAANLEPRKMLWKIPASDTSAMLLAGEHVILGRKDGVRALAFDSGEEVWNAPVSGRAFGLAVADGSLVVSTDAGEVVCFRRGDEAIAAAENARPPQEKKSVAKPIEEFTDDHLLGRWVFSPLAARRTFCECCLQPGRWHAGNHRRAGLVRRASRFGRRRA